MNWQPWNTAPETDDPILVADAFGVMWARFHPVPTQDDFDDICDPDEEGNAAAYQEWLSDLRNDPGQFYGEWEFGNFGSDSEIIVVSPTHWMPMPSHPRVAA